MEGRFLLEKDKVSLFPYSEDFIRLLKGALGFGEIENYNSALRIKGRFIPYILEEYNIEDEVIITPLGNITVITKGKFGVRRIEIGKFSLGENLITFNILFPFDHLEESVDWPNCDIDSKEVLLSELKKGYAKYCELWGLLIENITRVVQFILDKQLEVRVKTFGRLRIANLEYVGLEGYNDIWEIERELEKLLNAVLLKETNLKSV